MILLTCTISINNHWKNKQFYLHNDTNHPDQSCIAYTVDSLQSYTMFISRGPVIPLPCTISIDNHSRYCSVPCIMSVTIQISAQYLTDYMIKLNTAEMRSLSSWTGVGSTYQSLCKIPLRISNAKGVQWAAVWPKKAFVARIFKMRVWWATSAYKYGCPSVISGNSRQSGQWSCEGTQRKNKDYWWLQANAISTPSGSSNHICMGTLS